MCCSFWEKCKNSPKTALGCSNPLLMRFTASFSSGPQLYESWHEFPIDLLYKDVPSLDTNGVESKMVQRHGQKFETYTK